MLLELYLAEHRQWKCSFCHGKALVTIPNASWLRFRLIELNKIKKRSLNFFEYSLFLGRQPISEDVIVCQLSS